MSPREAAELAAPAPAGDRRRARCWPRWRAFRRERFVPADEQTAPTRTSRSRSAAARRSPNRLVVALMLEALRLQPTDRVLDVGTGSGYTPHSSRC